MTDYQPIRMGILGAATIVPVALTGPAHALPDVEIYAVAARDPNRARAFAAKHKIPHIHDSYAALLADPAIDAIYNPLPNSLHALWTIRALQAGKHVLCEKPLASNAAEAESMRKAAQDTGLVLSEGFAYRYHPLAAKMRDVIRSGQLGTIRHIEAHLCFPLPVPGNIRYRYDLAGGSLMDAGCYPVSMVRWLAQAEPTVIAAKAIEISPQVDRSMTADLQFPNGVTGRIACSILSHVLFDSSAVVEGDAGKMSVFNPHHPHIFNLLSIRTTKGTHRQRIAGENIYALQLKAFIRAIRGEAPLLTGPDDAVANMRVIDAIYEAAGLKKRGT